MHKDEDGREVRVEMFVIVKVRKLDKRVGSHR